MFSRFRARPTPAPPADEPRATVGVPIQLVVGLGNVGGAYANHRHNVGFWAVNRLANSLGLTFNRSGILDIAEGIVDGRAVAVVKPRTMMNLSGKGVQQALKRFGLKPSQMVVVYDDLDLPTGRVRVRARGSHGGHNGMKSIVNSIGAQDFARIRIGIGRPTVHGEPTWEPEQIAAWVLAAPGPGERALLEDAATRAAGALQLMLYEGVETAMAQYNRDPASAAPV